MKNILTPAALALAMPLTMMAQSASADLLPSFEIGVGESILGHTIEGGVRLNDRIGVRGMYGEGSYDFSGSMGDNDFDGTFHMGDTAAFLDLYPFGGALRLSGGAVKLGHAFDASTDGSFESGGNTYTTTVDANAKFKRSIAPAGSIGFNKSLFGTPLSLSADLGAVYTGGVDLTMTDRSGMVPQEEMDKQAEEVRDVLDRLTVAPFAKVGVTFTF